VSQRVQVKVTLPAEVVDQLDVLRGDASRSSFVESLVRDCAARATPTPTGSINLDRLLGSDET